MCDRFPREFDVQTSYKPLNCALGLIFVVNVNFPRATLSHDSAFERRTLLLKWCRRNPLNNWLKI